MSDKAFTKHKKNGGEMNSHRLTHLSGRCRSGGDHGGYIVHLVPTRTGSMGVAVCGKKPAAKSNGWSEHDDEKITCPRCLKRANYGTLPKYRRAK